MKNFLFLFGIFFTGTSLLLAQGQSPFSFSFDSEFDTQGSVTLGSDMELVSGNNAGQAYTKFGVQNSTVISYSDSEGNTANGCMQIIVTGMASDVNKTNQVLTKRGNNAALIGTGWTLTGLSGVNSTTQNDMITLSFSMKADRAATEAFRVVLKDGTGGSNQFYTGWQEIAQTDVNTWKDYEFSLGYNANNAAINSNLGEINDGLRVQIEFSKSWNKI